jgi:hypothetical protein
MVAAIAALRGPGESYSDMILRLAGVETAIDVTLPTLARPERGCLKKVAS